MAAWSMTKMLNVLTLALVALPGLTLSSNTNPWRELYERVQASAFQPTPKPLGGYVCCNQPPTPPSPRRPHNSFRTLLLSLAKRDDRNAPFRLIHDPATGREALMRGPSRASTLLGDNRPSYPETVSAQRDPLLAGILHVLRSSGRHRTSAFRSPDASLSGSGAGSRSPSVDFGFPANKRDDAGGLYGEIGGPNQGTTGGER